MDFQLNMHFFQIDKIVKSRCENIMNEAFEVHTFWLIKHKRQCIFSWYAYILAFCRTHVANNDQKRGEKKDVPPGKFNWAKATTIS